MTCIFGLDVDQPTADLIVQIQFQDAGIYIESCKGKSCEPTDEELAFKLQNEDLVSTVNFLRDRRMAISFAAAVQADGRILSEAQVEEAGASKDRHIARQFMNSDCATPSNDFESQKAGLDDETLAKLQILCVSGLEEYYSIDGTGTTDPENEQAESSAWAARRSRQPRSKLRQCVACGEETEFFNVARVPCQHEYCRSCLEALYKASITDESLFPPRCCRKPIDLGIARIFLNSDLVQLYERKTIEFETPNRTYCYSAICSAFINESHIDGSVATCPNCEWTTCTNCKGRAHTGDCPSDTAMQQLLSTAQENGWQRCYSCWRMVELDHGCNHMTFVVPFYPSHQFDF